MPYCASVLGEQFWNYLVELNLKHGLYCLVQENLKIRIYAILNDILQYSALVFLN